MTRKTPQDIEKANKELVKTNTDIMAIEAKLDKLYQYRRELVNYLDLNKKD
jgi:hypothetical protein